jgi:hypothetical protein
MTDDSFDLGRDEIGRPRKVHGLDLTNAERLRWLEEMIELKWSWDACTTEDPPGASRDEHRSRP